MLHNLSQSGITSSPNINMLGFNTPNGLGIEGGTPAAQMIATMSDLGLAASSSKRNEDEERRAKMRKVLRSIGRSKGRVSEEGIARISRRVGFQNDIDAEKLTTEDKERRVGNRPIFTAGKTVLIDFNLKSNVPKSVVVTFTTKNEALKQLATRAGNVLYDDLKASNGVQLDMTLDQFAVNLERLARIDRLSATNMNCFEALSGVYICLQRLYEQELIASKASSESGTAKNRRNIEVEVMCKKSGRPFMHEHGRIGLELMYWHHDRKLTTPDEQLDDHVCKLCIEAEAPTSTHYLPLRISESWLPDPLELPASDSGGGIPWQDPPPTYLKPASGETAMAITDEQKLPHLRFVAKLSPPLVMPYQVAMNVLSAVDAPPSEPTTVPPQYAALLLDLPPTTAQQSAITSPTAAAEQTILSQKDGEETTVTHIYTLTPAKQDYGFKLEDIPFSHPRQLIELLPTLRQWASFDTMLRNIFADSPETEQPAESGEDLNGEVRHTMTLDDLLATPEAPTQRGNVSVDITLATSPTPTLGVIFSNPSGTHICSVTVQILPNADVVVTSHEGIFPDDAAKDQDTEQAQKLARALDACGDLGVWIEWMRCRS